MLTAGTTHVDSTSRSQLVRDSSYDIPPTQNHQNLHHLGNQGEMLGESQDCRLPQSIYGSKFDVCGNNTIKAAVKLTLEVAKICTPTSNVRMG
jgi:hypothetical protein